MHKISISKVQPGMVLGKTIYTLSGSILLVAGMVLSEFFIKRLRDMGIPFVYIKDSLTNGIEVKDIIDEYTRFETQKAINEVFKRLQQSGKVQLAKTKTVVNNILNEILSNRNILINLADIRTTYDDEVFGHCANVCILSLITGVELSYNQQQLRDLGIGSLLHDIGKAKIEKQLLNKTDKLTLQEYEFIRKHSQYGFNILCQQEEINLIAAHVAYQHHERYDGSGYPRGMVGEEIYEYARITAVTDVYDAMTSERVYRSSRSIRDAVQELIDSSGTQFDPKIVRAFLKYVAIYPVGSIIYLNTGEVGVVMDVLRDFPDRPIVKVIIDNQKNMVNDTLVRDLTREGEVEVISILNDYDDTLPTIAQLSKRISKIE
ncbi:MAG: HD-GYP domain-containing protein [Clostridia bacterium]|nr:HD-GYP domain-containing protein [Clostridia bacterium]